MTHYLTNSVSTVFNVECFLPISIEKLETLLNNASSLPPQALGVTISPAWVNGEDKLVLGSKISIYFDHGRIVTPNIPDVMPSKDPFRVARDKHMENTHKYLSENLGVKNPILFCETHKAPVNPVEDPSA